MEAPFQHQTDGASWMAARYRCGLHDDMGLGKTRTAIMGLDNLGARRGIIVCKASIKENWRRELIRWAGLGRRVRKANDLTDCNDFLKYYYDTMIVSYEMMTRWRGFMMSRLSLLEFMIIDEAHNVKNPNAQRTKALKGENCDGIGAISQFAVYGWELTGTPIPNDPLDLYSFLKFCGKLGSMQQNDFACEYFSVSPGRYSSRQTVRPEKQKELQDIIRSVSLRRTGGVDIPPIFLTASYLDGDASKVSSFMRDHPGLDRVIVRALEGGNLNKIDHEQIMTLRRLIGEAKAIPFAYYLVDLMKGGLTAPVVFGWHISVLDTVTEILTKYRYKVGRIDGRTSHKATETAAAFELGELDVLVCNIQSGGEGLNMTRSKCLFMLESGFTPKDNSQPIKRIHRIGQKHVSRGDFIILAGSYDENIVGIVRSKVKAIFDIDGQQLLAAPEDATRGVIN